MYDKISQSLNPQSLLCMRRQYPEAPLIGVGAIVFDDHGRVLLVQRGKPPRLGMWSIPGGLLEVGEKLIDAVHREVREECGIEIEVGEVVLIYEPIFRDVEGKIEYHYVLVDYWARHIGGVAVANDDALAVAWVEISELTEYKLAQETYEVIVKARQKAAHTDGSTASQIHAVM